MWIEYNIGPSPSWLDDLRHFIYSALFVLFQLISHDLLHFTTIYLTFRLWLLSMSTKQIIIDDTERPERSFPGSSAINPNPSRFILTLPPAPSVPTNSASAAAAAAAMAVPNDVESQIALYWQTLSSDLQNSSSQLSQTGSPYVLLRLALFYCVLFCLFSYDFSIFCCCFFNIYVIFVYFYIHVYENDLMHD